MGYLCSDIKNEGLIIEELNLAPKMYKYEYIDNNNKIIDKDLATMKAKGIPKKCLKAELYDIENKNVNRMCTFSGLRKKHINLTKNDKENNLQHFSIVNSTQTREFYKNEWTGMTFKNSVYYPKGYVF